MTAAFLISVGWVYAASSLYPQKRGSYGKAARRVPLFEDNTHVFIVRIWREPREIEGAVPEWRGVIEHMGSAEKLYFRSLKALITFIIEKTGAEPMQPPPALGQGERVSLVRRLLALLGLQERHNA